MKKKRLSACLPALSLHFNKLYSKPDRQNFTVVCYLNRYERLKGQKEYIPIDMRMQNKLTMKNMLSGKPFVKNIFWFCHFPLVLSGGLQPKCFSFNSHEL